MKWLWLCVQRQCRSPVLKFSGLLTHPSTLTLFTAAWWTWSHWCLWCWTSSLKRSFSSMSEKSAFSPYLTDHVDKRRQKQAVVWGWRWAHKNRWAENICLTFWPRSLHQGIRTLNKWIHFMLFSCRFFFSFEIPSFNSFYPKIFNFLHH